MNTKNWKEALGEYAEDEDLLQLYEDWGDTGYLGEIFALLNEHEPDWNKERELGSWATEFILDLLEETEEELDTMSREKRLERFGGMLEERYEDYRSGHQFARINNVAIHAGNAGEDISESATEEGEEIGFPILL